MNIVQLDCSELFSDVIKDEKYSETEGYLKIGKLNTVYQSFLDANKILTKDEKHVKKNLSLEATNCVFR